MMSDPSHPPLPSRPEDIWQGGFLLVPSQPVRAVSAGNGLVISGGDGLHMMRPGAEKILSRVLPPAIRPIVATAAEPWAPRRFAIAAAGRISVFDGQEPEEPTMELRITDPRFDATHLAWVREKGEIALYFRGRNGSVGRLWLERQIHEYLDAPPMSAVAADESGVLGLLSVLGTEGEALIAEGDHYDCRVVTMALPPEEADSTHVYFAIHGKAVAYSIADAWGTYVSWGPDQDDFDLCKALWGGPIAFHGDDALFGAYCVETNGSIFREARDGTITRIADIEAEGSGDDAVVDITSLAWDASRRTLWGASPQVGLIQSREPSAKGEKKRVVLS